MHPVHSEETWLVTGGAGFIGANFVLEPNHKDLNATHMAATWTVSPTPAT